MEGPAAVMCLRTCYIKDCKPLHFAENPSELGQSHLSRNCSCSRRMMKQRRSNSISMCTLPIIPEYPGFQDIKVCMQKLSLQYMITTTHSSVRATRLPPSKLTVDMIVSLGLCFGIEKLNLKGFYSSTLLSCSLSWLLHWLFIFKPFFKVWGRKDRLLVSQVLVFFNYLTYSKSTTTLGRVIRFAGSLPGWSVMEEWEIKNLITFQFTWHVQPAISCLRSMFFIHYQ